MFNPFGSRTPLDTSSGKVFIYSLKKLEEAGIANVSRLPISIKILLEALLRHCDNYVISEDDVVALAQWNPKSSKQKELAFMPARVILQDFTGVPTVVDLAAMRSAMRRLGGDPKRINPLIPVDLVIDHSVQVDSFGSSAALFYNSEREFERNRERYEFLRWGQKSFDNFRVVPPATGIVHQVNLEYLAKVVQVASKNGYGDNRDNGDLTAFPDTVIGTDSHTTMINALSVLGWGVGGIEAEAVMLGQPCYMLTPEVVGVKLYGELPNGATATDLVLTVTQMLRKKGVVDKFVEFYGPGYRKLSLPDRATIANMSPEYGATIGFFPVDNETLKYLSLTGRDESLIKLVERYSKEQGLFRSDEAPEPEFSDILELNMGNIEPSLAGPKRPQDRIPLKEMKKAFQNSLSAPINKQGFDLPEEASKNETHLQYENKSYRLSHGSVAIAAITSCTNTSNPSVMLGAALLAKKAVERGLKVSPYVKTSLAPGSKVVTEYLKESGLMAYLEELRFHVVGYGCTTCIGNSGPLLESVAKAVNEKSLVVAAVLSGNRNFDGRINPLVKASYLASPPLVIAYALSGRVDIDFLHEPIGKDQNTDPVYLKDIWPSQEEIQQEIQSSLKAEMFKEQYAHVFEGGEQWNQISVPEGSLHEWNPDSSYIQEPTFFAEMTLEQPSIRDIKGARVLALLGDSVTTDHISPAGSIPVDSPAGRYLISRGIDFKDFNSFGSRRGNHEVMSRGTFGNIRLKNLLIPETEGGETLHLPSGEKMSIYEAFMRYKESNTPLIVIGGKEYGSGSSRDWAAKGPYLLGVKSVIVESFERIHRSNLVGMGILPLQFKSGENWQTLGLTAHEIYDIEGINDDLKPNQEVAIKAKNQNGDEKRFRAIVRIDSLIEMEYYRHGGILQKMLRQMIK